jgi:hypothetical protein
LKNSFKEYQLGHFGLLHFTLSAQYLYSNCH